MSLHPHAAYFTAALIGATSGKLNRNAGNESEELHRAANCSERFPRGYLTMQQAHRSLTHSITHSLTQPPTHAITFPLSHPRTQSLTDSLTHPTNFTYPILRTAGSCSLSIWGITGVNISSLGCNHNVRAKRAVAERAQDEIDESEVLISIQQLCSPERENLRCSQTWFPV